MLQSERTEVDVDALRAGLDGDAFGPDDDGWDEARRAWNLVADQRPAAVVVPAGVADVQAAVRLARERGLRVAAQGTGHGAAPLGPLGDAMLVRTARMSEFSVDAPGRTVRVSAGALWGPVAQATAEHGLAGLAGSARDVGVVGYALGGGIGWLARRFGIAANSVAAVELVTATGELVRADRDHEPELFWALRGGGGSFGVVTAMELSLVPVTEVYAGALFWPVEHAGDVLGRYLEWVGSVPDELTSVGRILHVPPLPFLPEAIRGKSFVVVEAAFVGPEAEGAALVAPLREVAPPAMDTFAVMPTPALGDLHGDPDQPVPGLGDHALLASLDDGAIGALVEAAGAASGTSLVSVELRHLGGALAEARPEHGALAALDGEFALFAVGMVAPEQAAVVDADLRRVVGALAPWSTGARYLNFDERPGGADGLFPSATYARLAAVKAAYDPDDLFRSNHPVAPAA